MKGMGTESGKREGNDGDRRKGKVLMGVGGGSVGPR